MKTLQIALLASLLLFLSCKKQPEINFFDDFDSKIKTDFNKWWIYYNDNIVLSTEFVALDSESKLISKKRFLELLISGNYIAINVKQFQKLTYKLYKLDENFNENIRNTSISESIIALDHYKKEGQRFSKFNFKDLNGKFFSSENTKGKIVVVKFWFIHCQKCVEEMPELNELFDSFKNKENFVFLSLALDSKTDLQKFLKIKQFNYPIVPNQKSFLVNELKINPYPTHIILDENGIILKVVTNVKELKMALKSLNK